MSGEVEAVDEKVGGIAVHIANRVMSAAVPGEVLVSGTLRDLVTGSGLEFGDRGVHELKGCPGEWHLWALVRDVTDTDDAIAGAVHIQVAEPARPSLPLPDKPSIAVLPFTNMSGDPEQDYFADGMVEDIITGLSRIKWIFVIARNSSFAYSGEGEIWRSAPDGHESITRLTPGVCVDIPLGTAFQYRCTGNVPLVFTYGPAAVAWRRRGRDRGRALGTPCGPGARGPALGLAFRPA